MATEKYTKNFSVAEFASKDGRDVDARMSPHFMEKLQDLREQFRHPININSGIRSKEHNKACGGSKNSRHLTRPCIAADIDTSKWRGNKLHKFLRLAFELGFTGIGIDGSFVHLDTRKSQNNAAVAWTY